MLLSLILPLALHVDVTGLERITVPAVRADVQFLADPALDGRSTPSPGLDIAAAFLENRMRRLGLSPAGEEGFRQAIPLIHRRIDPAGTRMIVEVAGAAHPLEFGVDYYPERLAHIVPWAVSGALVSGGTGQGVELDPLDLNGRWVALFDRGGQKMRPALQRLAEAGAAGAVITPAPVYGGDTYTSRFESTATKMLDGITNRPGRELEGPDLPVVTIPSDTWLRIEQLAGVELDKEEPPEAGTDLGVTLSDRRALVPPDQTAENVIGRLNGLRPELATEVIVVMAHYDGPGTLGGLHHPGADDNASGTAALLAVAEALVAHGGVGRSVLFVSTAGNGQGNLGAERFAGALGLEADERVVMVVELDSLGNGPPDGIQVGPSPTSTWYSDWIGRFAEAAGAEQFPVIQDAETSWARSEARQLATTLEVPTIIVTGGRHARHRTIDDRMTTVNVQKVVRAARATARLVIQAGS